MTANKDDIMVRVTRYHTKKTWSSSTTFFEIKTKNKLVNNLYDPHKEYVVERRFNDFKTFHDLLTNNADYKGRAIPSLPHDAKSYMDYF
jgi:hypothetical protein